MGRESSDLFIRIRRASAQVVDRARSVEILAPRLASLAEELAASVVVPEQADPAHSGLETGEATLAYIITLDAVNFGSGYFPQMVKREGCSGYFTVATGLRERFEAAGPLSAQELCALRPEDCADIFGQPMQSAPMAELMGHFARALRELGGLLESRFEGSFEALVASAGGLAERLVTLLAELPSYRDVARYADLEVPFYKRAQLTCADLSQAFAGRGPGEFRDLHRLTLFADNLVPHVLRFEGVLKYDGGLLERIELGELIPAGSAQEVEIRAAALHSVEQMSRLLTERGRSPTPQQLPTRGAPCP